MSSGNGKAGTRREAFAHNEAERKRALAKQERALAELEGSEWADEVAENHFHLPKGTTLEADRTGRLRAVSNPDDEITLTENPAPKQPDRLRLISPFVRPSPGGTPEVGMVG